MSSEERSAEARREAILRARVQLVAVLGEIAAGATAQSLVRCPYRTREDVCTFSGGCRNQVREGGRIGCSGGTLNAMPAVSAAVSAAVSDHD